MSLLQLPAFVKTLEFGFRKERDTAQTEFNLKAPMRSIPVTAAPR
jgi:hypothetical protein